MRLLQDTTKKVVRPWGVKIVQCQVLKVIFLPDFKKSFLFLTLNFVRNIIAKVFSNTKNRKRTSLIKLLCPACVNVFLALLTTSILW